MLRRIGFFVLTLWAAVTLNFLIPRLMPGNPAEAMMAQYRTHGINPLAIHALEIAFGVNDKTGFFQSYGEYLRNCLTGNFGLSLTQFPTPVTQLVRQALPWTLGLVGMTTVIAFVLGTLVGALGAWRRGTWLDNVLPPVFILTSAFPYFWVGMLSLWLFAITFHWLPLALGYDLTSSPGWNWGFIAQVLDHAALPALTIVVTSIGGWILTMRNTMVSVLADDYVKMARAKGLSSWRIMWHYAGRNAILPNLSGFAMSLGFVVSGAILVEYVFDYPGVGFMLIQAVDGQDYPLMQALFLLITVAVLVAVLIADFVTAWLDPRTRATT